MKNKRIFKDFQASKMSLNIYTSPLLAFAFVFIGEFVAFTLYGISLLALIGLARNFGETGQAFATYLQTLQQSLMDKTSDFHLILDLLAFGFILNTVFRWAKKIEKRSIRTLGFYRENFLSNFLKGFGLGLALFLLTLLGLVALGQYRFESIHLNPYSLAFVVFTIPFLDFTGDSRRSSVAYLAPSSIGFKNQSKTSCSYIEPVLYPASCGKFWSNTTISSESLLIRSCHVTLPPQNRYSLGCSRYSWGLEFCSGQSLWDFS